MEGNNTNNTNDTLNKETKRPVSPYLSVYKLQASSFFSIFTRITGVILLLGIAIPLLLFSHVDVGLGSYFWYSIMFFFFKSSYASLYFSALCLSFILSLLFHVVAVVRNVLSRTFWPTPYQKEVSYDPLQFFVYVPLGLIIPACIIYLLI